jgi:hypothetical protein
MPSSVQTLKTDLYIYYFALTYHLLIQLIKLLQEKGVMDLSKENPLVGIPLGLVPSRAAFTSKHPGIQNSLVPARIHNYPTEETHCVSLTQLLHMHHLPASTIVLKYHPFAVLLPISF